MPHSDNGQSARSTKGVRDMGVPPMVQLEKY
jgi:hypothetical protein